MFQDTLNRFFSAFGTRAQRYVAVLATICLVACSAADHDNQVMDRQGPLTTAVYRINCGGGAAGAFSADQFASGGNTWSAGNVSITDVANAAPASVYTSERYGNHAYTFGGLDAGASYVVRLHFAETKWNTAGARVFNVELNGTQALSNFDIFANAGFSKALALDFNTVASASGQIIVRYVGVVDNAKASGIEIFSNSSGPSGNQPPTIATAPSSSANPVTSTSSTLRVLGADDGGESSLVYTWSTTGTPPAPVSFSTNDNNAAKSTVATFSKAGNYALTVTVKDAAGLSTSGSLNLVVNDTTSSASATYRINCGGNAVSNFAADQFATGGSSWTDNVSVLTAGVANAAPAAVYQTERYGNHSYTFRSLTPGANYIARLHFAETKWTSAGSRVFNVSINGTQVLTNLDIFAEVGTNKALVRDVNAVASGAGQIVIQYVTVKDNARSSAIEILAIGGGGSPPSNAPPTVASPATANPNPTSGTTASLSVLGADDGGQNNLTYTWNASGPGAVSFSANSSNAARDTMATFTKAGNYTLTATIKDASGATATSSANVVVSQAATSIDVTPSSAQVQTGGSQQYLASVKDQFGTAVSPQPSVAWSVSGGGSISSLGVFSAGSSEGGPFTVTAAAASRTASASVTVVRSGGGAGQYSTGFNLSESPISEGGVWRQDGLDWTRVVTANGFAFGTQTGNNGFNDSYAYLAGSFAADQSGSAVIHLEPGLSGGYLEVEILLRWRDSAHYSTGYECNLAYNGQYAEIIQWPGEFGTQKSQFKFISSGNPVSGGVHDGDTFQCDVVGNVITSRLNGRVIARGTDSSLPSGGAPGIGFYAEGQPASQKFSFSQFAGGSL